MVAAVHSGEGRVHPRSDVAVGVATQALAAAGCGVRGETLGRFKHLTWLVRMSERLIQAGGTPVTGLQTWLDEIPCA
jgi:hypothetical protein